MLIDFKRSGFFLHPLAAFNYLRGKKRAVHELMLHRAGKILLQDRFDRKLSDQVIRELRRDDFIPMNSLSGVQLPGNRPTYFFGKFLYYIVRMSRPTIMVETGVAHGVSSWTILNAMERNGAGKLCSIDLPDLDLKSYNPGNIQKTSGWAVPDALRHRWELRLGSSKELLPAWLQELGEIDVFFHDSDHSYENMLFEFSTALPHLKKKGLIVSDDVHKNAAFAEFAGAHSLTGVRFFTKGGAACLDSAISDR
ncbi:MAG: class I SAM-dependent methyltransferase [Bacteroidota bacterium]